MISRKNSDLGSKMHRFLYDVNELVLGKRPENRYIRAKFIGYVKEK